MTIDESYSWWVGALERDDGMNPPSLADAYGPAVPLPEFEFCGGGRRAEVCPRRVTRVVEIPDWAPGVWGWSCGTHQRRA